MSTTLAVRLRPNPRDFYDELIHTYPAADSARWPRMSTARLELRRRYPSLVADRDQGHGVLRCVTKVRPGELLPAARSDLPHPAFQRKRRAWMAGSTT
jgi:hypothetical protein